MQIYINVLILYNIVSGAFMADLITFVGKIITKRLLFKLNIW